MLLMALLMATASAPAPAVPEQTELSKVIAAASAEYFDVFFNRCEPERIRNSLTPDFEFYHDVNGLRTRDEFVASYARRCKEWGKPGVTQLRRALVAGSMKVFPLPGYGAIEEATHEFTETPDGVPPWKGTARYLQIWKATPQGWKIARVVSYDH